MHGRAPGLLRAGAPSRRVAFVLPLAGLPMVALALALALAPAAVHAERVYRCGADGREFSQTPCPGATGRAVEVADPRDAEQLAEARSVADRASTSADRIARERAARRDAQRPLGAGSLSGPFGRVRVPFAGHDAEAEAAVPDRCVRKDRHQPRHKSSHQACR